MPELHRVSVLACAHETSRLPGEFGHAVIEGNIIAASECGTLLELSLAGGRGEATLALGDMDALLPRAIAADVLGRRVRETVAGKDEEHKQRCDEDGRSHDDISEGRQGQVSALPHGLGVQLPAAHCPTSVETS